METTLSGEKTIAFSIANEILMTSVNIPVIPDNGMKILETIRQPEEKIDIAAFIKLVESDPGLFTRILQLSNSPFYGHQDKIVSLRSAITRIGLIDTVNTVGLYFFQKMLPKFPDIQGFSYHKFWSHSWICAVANRLLGHPGYEMDVMPGDLYMAGMLHGLGKLLLAIHFPDDFSKCVKRALEQKLFLHKVEKDVFGTTDALVASRVLHIWNLPAMVCEGIAFYQTPESAPPEYKIIAGLTQFAYAIAENSGVGCSGDGLKIDLASTFLGQKPNLKISDKDIQASLVSEVMNSMKNKIGNVSQKHREDGRQIQKINKFVDLSTGKPSNNIKKTKKGILGWAKSIWRRD